MNRRSFLNRSFLTIGATYSAVTTVVVPQILKKEIKLTPTMEFDTKVWRDSENKVHKMEFPDGTIVHYERNNVFRLQYPQIKP